MLAFMNVYNQTAGGGTPTYLYPLDLFSKYFLVVWANHCVARAYKMEIIHN